MLHTKSQSQWPFGSACTKILTKIHPNYRWITGETDMEFQFSSWNWQGDGILAKIQVGLPKDSMWIFLIPAGNFQAHGISFSWLIHLECFLIAGFYRTQYPASYTHKSLGRTPKFTLPGSAGTQTCLLCLSLKSQIPKLFRNDSVFPIFTAYL